ncbi:hypothetical protein GLAREA_10854 [Glarea lozoyensis ATCC 20868]|uniref:Uncharacterized protein n=1 Tax=Glarea lozoyensis (strain ATCC 20868 / MF5171) TaxID=1116229 RepID=S3E9Z7_GLAL2|nr:uncharacterized protein GLAREA_10854 [Glarea lozoyensis ATCC 20868]EPE35158.1 hypothetical protein GLAREA_10854 [Glarea lozoyensis ATCC 20868]
MHLHLLTLLFTTTTLAHTTLSRPCPTYGGDPALCSNGISILPIIAHETLGKPCPTYGGNPALCKDGTSISEEPCPSVHARSSEAMPPARTTPALSSGTNPKMTIQTSWATVERTVSRPCVPCATESAGTCTESQSASSSSGTPPKPSSGTATTAKSSSAQGSATATSPKTSSGSATTSVAATLTKNPNTTVTSMTVITPAPSASPASSRTTSAAASSTAVQANVAAQPAVGRIGFLIGGLVGVWAIL